MFKVENLDQINNLTYNPIRKKNKYKYIIINKQYIDKKYEIGKRYKQDITFYNELSGLPSYAISKSENFKIMEIKLFGKTYYNIASDFKIVREMNYLDLLDSDDIVENMISAIKNHEEIVLDAFLNSKEKIYLEVVINSGVHKYLDEIITEYINGETKYEDMVSLIIREYGRNKDLDNFINCNEDKIKCKIADVGRPQDLDILINSGNFYVINSVLKNGRSKDINKYIEDIEDIEDCFHCSSIIKTGIDKYLDKFVNNKIYCPFLISEQGRKCDLDILVHDEDEDIRKAVAYHGYDDHLDILAKENNPKINQIINRLRGKREI